MKELNETAVKMINDFMIKNNIEEGSTIKISSEDGDFCIIHKCTKKDKVLRTGRVWQVSSFKANGDPYEDECFFTYKEAIASTLGWYTIVNEVIK